MDTTQRPTPRRVLVAEDDDDARSLLSMLLRTSGYEVVEAADGIDALQAIEHGGFQVALLDIGLPGMDGEAVVRSARSALSGRALHMVAVTGYGEAADVSRLIGAGFDSHLVKPVDFARLRVILQNHAP